MSSAAGSAKNHSPTVFISYSWDIADGPEHKNWVRYLAECLTEKGVDVLLDQWGLIAGESSISFMTSGVQKSDYVLIICTPFFAKKADAKEGGVGFEQQIVSGYLLYDQSLSKFIPLLRTGAETTGYNCAIPAHLLGRIYIDFRKDENFETNFGVLLRRIYNKPEYIPPPKGEPPNFLSRPKPSNGVRLEIVVGQDCRFKGGENKAVETVISYLSALQLKKQIEIKTVVKKFSRELLRYRSLSNTSENLSIYQKKNLLELRTFLVNNNLIFGWQEKEILLDDLISNQILFLFREFSENRSSFLHYEEVATSIRMLVELEFGDKWQNEGQQNAFDVVHPNGKYFFIVYITDDELSDLLRKTKVEVTALTLLYGLTLFDLGRRILIEQAIPKCIQLFFELERRGEEIDENLFFDLDGWQVGIH